MPNIATTTIQVSDFCSSAILRRVLHCAANDRVNLAAESKVAVPMRQIRGSLPNAMKFRIENGLPEVMFDLMTLVGNSEAGKP